MWYQAMPGNYKNWNAQNLMKHFANWLKIIKILEITNSPVCAKNCIKFLLDIIIYFSRAPSKHTERMKNSQNGCIRWAQLIENVLWSRMDQYITFWWWSGFKGDNVISRFWYLCCNGKRILRRKFCARWEIV